MKSTRSDQPLPALPTDEPVGDRVSVAERSVQRTLENRRTAYSEEVARLIEAAVVVMQRSTSKNPTVSVSDTITEAGLSNQAFYRHFQGKDEFLLAILDDGLRQLLVYLEREMYEDAENFFQKTLLLGPNLIEAYYEMGRAYWFNDQKDDALDAWKRGFAANKFNPWGKRCAELLKTVEGGGEPSRT